MAQRKKSHDARQASAILGHARPRDVTNREVQKLFTAPPRSVFVYKPLS